MNQSGESPYRIYQHLKRHASKRINIASLRTSNAIDTKCLWIVDFGSHPADGTRMGRCVGCRSSISKPCEAEICQLNMPLVVDEDICLVSSVNKSRVFVEK